MTRTSWTAVVLVIVVGSAVGIGAGSFLAWWLPVMKATNTGLGDLLGSPFGDRRYVRILMVGEDDSAKRNANGNGLSDTLVVFALDTETREVRAVSIPRDTRVAIPSHGKCKINAAHVYGGPELTRQVVNDLLGVDVDYYVKINTAGLRGMVDLLGGIYIVVDKNMRYTDRRGGLRINLKANTEKQLLNGRDAEGYVRFRHDRDGDCGWDVVDGKRVPTGRIVRQQYFFRALANRILSLPTKRQRADFLRQSYEKKYIVSDLNMKDWDGLADILKDIRPEKIIMDVLPGELREIGGGSYVIPDYEKIADVVARNLLFEGPVGEQMAKVEVLNGSGKVGAASRVADRLKEAGFEVTRTDNATTFDYDKCCVIKHNGSAQGAERIAALLDCDDIREESASGGKVDVTVIVGRDYID